jgi:hypothetical protein
VFSDAGRGGHVISAQPEPERPHGDGLFLWVNMQTDTNALAEICSRHGLLLAPGSLFTASGTEH